MRNVAPPCMHRACAGVVNINSEPTVPSHHMHMDMHTRNHTTYIRTLRKHACIHTNNRAYTHKHTNTHTHTYTPQSYTLTHKNTCVSTKLDGHHAHSKRTHDPSLACLPVVPVVGLGYRVEPLVDSDAQLSG